MDNDHDTQLVIAALLEAASAVNKFPDHKATICKKCLDELKGTKDDAFRKLNV